MEGFGGACRSETSVPARCYDKMDARTVLLQCMLCEVGNPAIFEGLGRLEVLKSRPGKYVQGVS